MIVLGLSALYGFFVGFYSFVRDSEISPTGECLQGPVTALDSANEEELNRNLRSRLEHMLSANTSNDAVTSHKRAHHCCDIDRRQTLERLTVLASDT